MVWLAWALQALIPSVTVQEQLAPVLELHSEGSLGYKGYQVPPHLCSLGKLAEGGSKEPTG